MAYHVEIDKAHVLDYFCHPERDLSEADIDTILGLLEGLADSGEGYRNEPSRRCPPGLPLFEVAYIFIDSAGRLRNFRFIISDAAVSYGVLRVCFAEEL